jgi:hypothetical protein
MDRRASSARHLPIAIVPMGLQRLETRLTMRPTTDDIEPIYVPQSYEKNMALTEPRPSHWPLTATDKGQFRAKFSRRRSHQPEDIAHDANPQLEQLFLF